MMSTAIDTTDLSTVTFAEPANSGGTASVSGNTSHKVPWGDITTLAAALSLFLGYPHNSADTAPIKIPMQDRFSIGATITSNWQDKSEQDLTEWFRSTREEFGPVHPDNRARFYKASVPAHDDVMPYLAQSLRNLAELPARVKSSTIFENDISDEALVSATKFLKQLGGILAKAGGEWREPHFSTEDHGDVEFAWWNEDKTLLISITETDVHYLRVWGPDINNEMDENVNPTSEKLIEIWHWLYG